MKYINFISCEAATIAFDKCINEAATGSIAGALMQAKEAVLSQTETMYNVQLAYQGHWIHRRDMDYKDLNHVIHVHGMCSECGFIHDFIDGNTAQYNYCPECGADLRVDGDTE